MILALSLQAIAFHPILGRPLIVWGGVFTLLILLLTATVAGLNRKGIHTIPIIWHYRLAYLTLLLALVHGIIGILLYF
jgi:uncharacterized membrane protein